MNQKGALALETIVVWIILMVAAAVIIGLVLLFSDEIKVYLGNIFKKGGEFKTDRVEVTSFSTYNINTYIAGCWDRTGVKFHEDVICYILDGDVSGVDLRALALPPDAISAGATLDIINYDITKPITVVRFKQVTLTVVVEN